MAEHSAVAAAVAVFVILSLLVAAERMLRARQAKGKSEEWAENAEEKEKVLQ